MKLIVLFFAALLFAAGQTPDCTYTLQHAPAGSIIVFRNGVAVQESDYTRSNAVGSTGLRTVAIARFADQDRMMFYYSYQASSVKVYQPTKEYMTCTGDQNPPPPSYTLPFTVTDTTVDFGTREISAGSLNTKGDGHSRIYLMSGDPPVTTVVSDVTYDAVLYLDPADNKVKILTKEGIVVALWSVK